MKKQQARPLVQLPTNKTRGPDSYVQRRFSRCLNSFQWNHLQTIVRSRSSLMMHRFCKGDVHEFCCLPTGMKEEAMGRTMTLKDDFGVIAWTWRAGNYLSLFLLLSLFSSSALSDIPFPKNQHFSWKTGKSSFLHFKYNQRLCFRPAHLIFIFRHFFTNLPFNLPFLTNCGECPLYLGEK